MDYLHFIEEPLTAWVDIIGSENIEEEVSIQLWIQIAIKKIIYIFKLL